MGFWRKSSKVPAQKSDPWTEAIAAAEAGHREDALAAFGRAIESNPDFYISTIRPETQLAMACWNEAVARY